MWSEKANVDCRALSITRLEGRPLTFAADAGGYGESRGMRVDVFTGRGLTAPRVMREDDLVDTNRGVQTVVSGRHRRSNDGRLI